MNSSYPSEDDLPKVGTKVVVYGIMPPATVSDTYYCNKTSRYVIELDWQSRGKSRVYLHDKNNIWYTYKNSN